MEVGAANAHRSAIEAVESAGHFAGRSLLQMQAYVQRAKCSRVVSGERGVLLRRNTRGNQGKKSENHQAGDQSYAELDREPFRFGCSRADHEVHPLWVDERRLITSDR